MKKRIFTLMTVILFSFPLLSCKTKRLETKMITIRRNDNTIAELDAEIADTPETRNYGFMNRTNIPDGTGMLFVFDYDQILSFWMKDTPHPLSIAYIDSKGRIRDILDMTPFSLSPILSSSSVRYALEVPQGWFKKNNISVGDKLIIR